MKRPVSDRATWNGQQAVRSLTVLTERMASAIVDHEAGWRLPQPSALARRYNASIVEIDRAIQELVSSNILRRMPDGRLYRASPADYLIALEGLPGIGAYIDPMGASITCSHRHVSWRQLPDDVGLALGLPSSASCTVIRSQWTANGHRAAVSTTYLPDLCRNQIDKVEHSPQTLDEALTNAPVVATASEDSSRLVPAAVQVEVRPPARSIAKSLELRPGTPAITVAVRFIEASGRSPVGLTVAVFRADLFRITIESAGAGMRELQPAVLASSIYAGETTT